MPKKILIIEDESDQILMLRTRLEAIGFEIISTLDGKEGLKKAREERPNLILLDLIMPKMNGYEVCKRLKASAATSDIPIIVITASGAKDLEKKCLNAGAADCVKKPYEALDLMEKINSLIE